MTPSINSMDERRGIVYTLLSRLPSSSFFSLSLSSFTVCFTQSELGTFVCMRLHLRGLTPSETGMDDRQGTRKGNKLLRGLSDLHNISIIYFPILKMSLAISWVKIRFTKPIGRYSLPRPSASLEVTSSFSISRAITL
jgi:hypothetical protein